MIIGKSYSGKDTLLEMLLSDEEFCKAFNLYRLVRYTNRKKREGEVEGKTYHFITDNECERFKNNDEVIITSYDSAFGLLHYITDLSELEEDKNYIAVSDLESIESYKCLLGERLVVICLMPPNWVLFQRFSKRDDVEDSELKYKEICRRFMDDLRKFYYSLNKCIANCNCIINLNREFSINVIKSAINDFIIKDYCGTGYILEKDEYHSFNNNYEPTPFKENTYQMLEGHIGIRDGNISLYTEKEKFGTNLRIPIKKISL